MDCDISMERVYSYLDGELAPAQAAAFDLHLEGCARCRERLAAEKEFDRQVRAGVARREVPVGLFEGILAQLEEEPPAAGPVALEKSPCPSWAERLRAGWSGLPWAVRLAPLIMIVAAGVTVYLTAATQPQSVDRSAVAAHIASLKNDAPPDIVTADVEQIVARFQDATPFNLAAPHVHNPAARLTGARLTEVGGEAAVEFQYLMEGQRFSTYYLDTAGRPMPDLPPERIMDKGPVVFYLSEYQGRGVVICYHKWDGTACLIVADMPVDRVLALMTGDGAAG